jgi:hypothetical protein
MQVYDVLSGLSPGVSLGTSLSEGENPEWAIKADKPKVRKLVFRGSVFYAYICHFPFQRRRLENASIS